MQHCCITGLRLRHKPMFTEILVHPEFYTLSHHDAACAIAGMYDGAIPLDKLRFRLAFAVVLRYCGILHRDVASPPYEPKRLDEIDTIDFQEEVAAAYQLQSWATGQVTIKIAEITDHTARSIMEGVAYDSTSFVLAAISSLPVSLSQQLYSWSETAAKLAVSLADMSYSREDISYIIRVALHLAALEQPQPDEPIDTYEILEARVLRMIASRKKLFRSLADEPMSGLTGSERRMLKLVTCRSPAAPKIVLADAPVESSAILNQRLAELRERRVR